MFVRAVSKGVPRGAKQVVGFAFFGGCYLLNKKNRFDEQQQQIKDSLSSWKIYLAQQKYTSTEKIVYISREILNEHSDWELETVISNIAKAQRASLLNALDIAYVFREKPKHLKLLLKGYPIRALKLEYLDGSKVLDLMVDFLDEIDTSKNITFKNKQFLTEGLTSFVRDDCYDYEDCSYFEQRLNLLRRLLDLDEPKKTGTFVGESEEDKYNRRIKYTLNYMNGCSIDRLSLRLDAVKLTSFCGALDLYEDTWFCEKIHYDVLNKLMTGKYALDPHSAIKLLKTIRDNKKTCLWDIMRGEELDVIQKSTEIQLCIRENFSKYFGNKVSLASLASFSSFCVPEGMSGKQYFTICTALIHGIFDKWEQELDNNILAEDVLLFVSNLNATELHLPAKTIMSKFFDEYVSCSITPVCGLNEALMWR